MQRVARRAACLCFGRAATPLTKRTTTPENTHRDPWDHAAEVSAHGVDAVVLNLALLGHHQVGGVTLQHGSSESRSRSEGLRERYLDPPQARKTIKVSSRTNTRCFGTQWARPRTLRPCTRL